MLDDDDKKWVKSAIVEGVVEAFNMVIQPYVDNSLQDLKDEIRNDVRRLERKLDNVTDHQAEKLDDLDSSVTRLELKWT